MQRKVKKATGWGGKCLKEMLEERERLYQEAGCYYGLRELPLRKRDPLKLEVLASRLLAAVIAGRETTRMISASPLVRDVAELAVALYTPEGDCMIHSTGIVIHIPLMGQVVQWMIRQNYEDEEGINEGDSFTCNDNFIAGMHTPDVYDIMPIFWEGQVVGWVGNVIMEPELGALAPGCMPSGATERFVEGLRFSAEKTAVNDRHTKSFERRIRFGCRMPDFLLLDRKGALACNIKVREEVKKIIKEVGVDYYMGGVRELIEIERRAQLERVKRRTVPGKFHSPTTYEIYLTRTIAPPHHAIDGITLVPCDFHIKSDGTYFLDFDGAGPWHWHSSNTSPSAIMGAACLMLTQTIAYTGGANQGTFLSVNINAPYDTFVNPSSPNVASGMFFSWPIMGGAIWLGQQSRAFFSRGFVEECRAPTPLGVGASGVSALAGKSHFGMDFGFQMMDAPGLFGGGAFAIRDGVLSDIIFLPESDMGNYEVWEMVLPLLWTGVKFVPNTCGWGKYRSGRSLMRTNMVYRTELLSLDTTSMAHCEKIGANSGLFGGYPGHGGWGKIVKNPNTMELIAQRKSLAHGEGYPGTGDLEQNITGELIVPQANAYVKGVFRHGDWFQGYMGAGGGLGDPIKRSLELVKQDLDSGVITINHCRRIYCVEARYDVKAEEWTIDEKKTAELREKRGKERLAKGIPAKEWWRKRRQDILEAKLPPMLKEMYNGSLAKGKRWSAEFRDFWHLPEDFYFSVEEN
jgi:N-methylhydantoinase B/oxoprolinase/acetone carboxylase alpha subunit